MQKLHAFGAGLSAAILIGSVAQGATYDAVAGFSSANPSGPWSYGWGETGVSFSPYDLYSTDCSGLAELPCWKTSTSLTGVPAVAHDTVGPPHLILNTLVAPSDVLISHPGEDANVDSIIRFTAPTSGQYRMTGLFEMLDIYPTGVNVIINGPGFTWFWADIGLAQPAVAPDQPGEWSAWDTPLFLNAGDHVDFGVNNDGWYSNDSTGFAITFATGVPEPAAWNLMIAGFGLAGLALRRRVAPAVG